MGGVVVGVFCHQVDRLWANLAESVSVIVGIDDDSEPIISAVARTLDRRSTLVAVASAGDERVQRTRRQGARVVLVDFNRPSSLVSLRLWRNLGRLYLMSADPATNLSWLELITNRLSEVAHEQRLPLIVRIDDPWLAEARGDQQFGGSNTRWAADVIGKYAVPATLVDSDDDEYLRDHELYRQQAGAMSEGPSIEAVAETPTASTLQRLIGDSDPKTIAAILVDSHVSTAGARLAARFPEMPVYA
ncbi:MAG TPA: hypothetical protein VGC05_08805 [Mycobacterium sp.]